jgi:hypothetical protein
MAHEKKSQSAGGKRTGQIGKLGETARHFCGGTDFMIARNGEDFKVPIRKAAWQTRQNVKEIVGNGDKRRIANGFREPRF